MRIAKVLLRRAGRSDRLVFTLALAVLAFAWGVATMNWQIFPYPLIRDAKAAWASLARLEPADFPRGFLGPVPAATGALPVLLAAPGAGTEALLVTGGFFELMEECPRFGCMAWVMDRAGRILHRWEADPAAIFADVTGMSGEVTPANFFITGLALAADGGLVTVFQSRNMFPYQVGIARFDIDGRLVWKRFDRSHHWPTLAPDGTILVPSARILPAPEPPPAPPVRAPGPRPPCPDGRIYSEGVRALAPDGTVLREFWFDDILSEGAYPGLGYALRDGCDPHHVNGIALLTPAAAARLPGTRAGDLVVSLREPSALAVIDGTTGVLRHLIAHRFAGQHSPRLLPGGEIVVFDNLGGLREEGGSRILVLDPATGGLRVVFPQAGTSAPALPFYSDEAGVVEVSPDGTRLLISESRRGRILEVEIATGRPVFILDKILGLRAYARAMDLPDAGAFGRFTAQGAAYVPADSPVLARPRPAGD